MQNQQVTNQLIAEQYNKYFKTAIVARLDGSTTSKMQSDDRHDHDSTFVFLPLTVDVLKKQISEKVHSQWAFPDIGFVHIRE